MNTSIRPVEAQLQSLPPHPMLAHCNKHVTALLADPSFWSEETRSLLKERLRAINEIETRFAAGDMSEDAFVSLGELGHEIINEIQTLHLRADLRRAYVRPVTPQSAPTGDSLNKAFG